MGEFWDAPIPTLGEIGTSLKNKFGGAVQSFGNQVQAATLAAKYGQGQGKDPTPDNDPSASAVAVRPPSARADIKGPTQIPGADAYQPGADVTRAATLGDEMARRGMSPGAFKSQAGFGEFGSSAPRSLAQTLQDREAAAQLDKSYGARMAENLAEAPDYQGDALRAKVRDAEYTANSESPQSLYAKFNDKGEQTAPGSFYQSSNGTFLNTPSGPTLKQQFQMQQDRLKNASGVLDLGRGELAGQLDTLRNKLDVSVDRRIPWNGKILSRAEADAIYDQAAKSINGPVSILKSGFAPNDPNAIPGGTGPLNPLPGK